MLQAEWFILWRNEELLEDMRTNFVLVVLTFEV